MRRSLAHLAKVIMRKRQSPPLKSLASTCRFSAKPSRLGCNFGRLSQLTYKSGKATELFAPKTGYAKSWLNLF